MYSNRRIRSSGAIKNAARAAQMGTGKLQFSDNFLAEHKEEARRRGSKCSLEALYHCQCKCLADRQKQKCLSVCESLN
ncbi:hypothetical protein BGC07_18905 [Piscirickettsia litoralis]|uniref:Uncharacterized protein n=1 Tax=Piscirickettsia litoralis TaxID=1891921 RepID=A0ABX3A488_9GAMM|nr:hypothetical protein BGC07_18905 [Piscirickettsia litoralis]